MDHSVTPWRPLIQSGHWVWIVRSLRKRWESAEPLSTEGLLVVISRQETEGLGEEGRRPLINVLKKSWLLLPLMPSSFLLLKAMTPFLVRHVWKVITP